MTARHAYCIMVHNEPLLLKQLLRVLDDGRNDVFVHVDAKADRRQFDGLTCEKAGLYWTPRVAVYWGDMSFAVAELTLLKNALAHGDYDYIHLLSGVDLPLKSQGEIQRFFAEHAGEEFVDFSLDERNRRSAFERAQRYYFFVRALKVRNGKLRRIFKAIMEGLVALQVQLHIRRNRFVVFYKGSNWISITGDCAKWLTAQESRIRKLFHHTLCCDELFVQTLLMASPFAQRISPLGNLRKIDWSRGDPYTWQNGDFEELVKSSGCLFARKFSSWQIELVKQIAELAT